LVVFYQKGSGVCVGKRLEFVYKKVTVFQGYIVAYEHRKPSCVVKPTDKTTLPVKTTKILGEML
jgi:hypothetical protein